MYEQNLQLLKKTYPEVYLEVIDDSIPHESEILLERTHTKSGLKNLKINKEQKQFYLHSSYNPRSEANKWIDSSEFSTELVIVVGGGYYYHIDQLLCNHPDKKIIIVEPSREIFKSALENIDMKKYVENNNILLMLSKNPYHISLRVANLLINKGFQHFDLTCLQSYKTAYNHFYSELNNSIYETFKMLRSNIATEYVHSQKWMYNNIRNLTSTNIDSINISSYFKKFKGMPALIVAAGPSLNKQLPLLKGNLDKFVVIAAGSAVNILEKNNIIPHFVVAVDGEEVQDNIFKNILNPDRITLIYSHSLRYSSQELFQGKKVWMKGNADETIEFFEDYVGIKSPTIEFGPSCANEAMEVARRLGCNQLIFIGQDLAYTDEQLYSKGAVHDLDIHSDIGDRIVMKDMYGNEIKTKTAFLVMKAYFENYIQQHNEVEYINCTEGGLEIKGMHHTTFQEVITHFIPHSTNVFDTIDNIYAEEYTKNEHENFKRKNRFFLEYVKNEAVEIKSLSEKRMKKTKKLLKIIEETRIDDFKIQFDEVNAWTEEIESFEVHNRIIHPIVAAFELAVRQNTYQKISGNPDLELKETYELLINGLKKQYDYYHVILTTLMTAIEDGMVD
jgi:hypothetical protein